jgi:KUP system potassium uptake protein
MAALALGALGVVFGDIGTSPLYALQAVFGVHNHEVHATPADVYGVISMVFWSITTIVSVKYVSFVMRADNRGEGGIMALTALLERARLADPATKVVLITLGVLGASLFYGDGVITPAISVSSAVAGLKVAAPSLGSVVLPVTVVVLTVLFVIQRFGTGFVGRLFGPVMAVWFGVLGAVGAIDVAHHPDILRALSPTYAVQFFVNDSAVAFAALSAVVLAVTGAEALYADMGHFGRAPIARAWFFLVFPALTLHYLAQGSLILRSPRTAADPFFLLFPGWAQVPMVVLATVATIIASQAVISGAFSVTRQAMQLGLLPRVAVRQTSRREHGQIYVPAVNATLFLCVLAVVVAFGSSVALASAYGVAVTGTFILDTILLLAVARLIWRKPWRLIALGAAVFLTVDVAFFSANLTKIAHGGWVPLVIAATVFGILKTWGKGREIVTTNRRQAEGPLRDFIDEVGDQEVPVRSVPGVGVFLSPNQQTTPLALRANVEHNHVLHDHVVIVSVEVERVPHISSAERVVPEVQVMFSGATGDQLPFPADRITGLTLRFGFLDNLDVPAGLRLAVGQGLIEGDPDLDKASYFLSHVTIVLTDAPGLSHLRKRLYRAMAQNAADPAEYFGLPDRQTVTLGGRIPI